VKILIIEDDPDFRVLTPEHLKRRLTVTCTTVASGTAALKLLLSGETYQLVISDFLLPDMNGIEILYRIRAAHIPFPFLLFTNHPGISVPKVTASGFVGVFQKREIEKMVEAVSLLVA
jgi:two-component system response regulator HydG